MEIHPSHGIHSVRDFLIELVTITIGILIALSLEGLIEWHHHRKLAHEAEQNLQLELLHNQEELNKGMQAMSADQANLQQAVDLVHKLQQDRTISVNNLTVNWTLEELHATSWNTANSTGALAYMGYSEVARYSRVYDLQEEFRSVQNRMMDALMGVYGLTTLLEKGPKRISNAELEQAERTLGVARANARAVENIGDALKQEYVNILDGH
jgi:hypothetical protein